MTCVLAVLAGVLAVLLAWPGRKHPIETRAEHVARLGDEMDRLAAQSGARCPAEWGRLATEKDLRIALFYGYANFDERVLDEGFAIAMASVLASPCRGRAAACGFVLVAEEPHLVRLTKRFEERAATIDVRWTSIGPDDRENRRSPEQARESRVARDLFHRALRESDVVLFTGHSRAGGGLGFEPASALAIATGALFRSEARATAGAMGARPSRLELLGVMACDADAYYGAELHAANPRARLVLARAAIASNETDPINLALLDAVLAQRCRADVTSKKPIRDAVRILGAER